MKKSDKYQIYQVVVSGLLLSLSFVLGMISKLVPFFRMPSGGGISLAMIPLSFVGLILGPIYGLVSGFLYGVFNMLIDGAFSWGFPSILLDYFLSYSSAFVCGFFRKYFYKKKIWSVVVSLSLFIVLRFFFHFLSGVILYNPYIDETGIMFSLPAVLYSTIYNLGYLLPTFIISLLVSLMIIQPIFRLFNNNIFLTLGKKYYDKENDHSSIEIILYYLTLISFVSMIISFAFNVSYDEMTINFSFLAIISLIISTYALINSVYLIYFRDENEYKKELIRYKVFKTNYRLHISNIILIIPIITLSITSICLNYL